MGMDVRDFNTCQFAADSGSISATDLDLFYLHRFAPYD
jgi:hypothetical protein